VSGFLLCDRYADDWDQLWWVRTDGVATLLGAGGRSAALAGRVAKYPQYQQDRPQGPVISVSIGRLTGWCDRG